MGLRSFVALPIDQGGIVARLFMERNADTDVEVLTTSLALGVSPDQALFAALPYRLSPSGGERTGDVGLLYRHIVWRVDTRETTTRLGLLGGVVVPTGEGRDPRVQAGAVMTRYQDRHEWDAAVLWREGLGAAPDSARYDLSWQYRLAPARYPDWGIPAQWNRVLELGGRWTEGNTVTHQITAGLQWVHPQWVFEGGVTQDLNALEHTRFILSMRFHF